MAYRVRGTYLESCNCEAICPCRRIDGMTGGRSTYGICLGALSWHIERGEADDLDVSDLGVVLASRYSDDDAGSPWTFILYIDERADAAQRNALEQVFLGRLGGTGVEHFPWAWKDSNLLAVRSSRIEIDHTPGRGWFRAGNTVSVRVSGPYEGAETVTCVIPGHERSGRELVVEELRVEEQPPLRFALTARCAYESTFDYEGR